MRSAISFPIVVVAIAACGCACCCCCYCCIGFCAGAIHVNDVTTLGRRLPTVSCAMFRLVVGLTFLRLCLLVVLVLLMLLLLLLLLLLLFQLLLLLAATTSSPPHRILIPLVSRIWSECCVKHGHRSGYGLIIAAGLQELLQRHNAIAIDVHFLWQKECKEGAKDETISVS